MSDKVVHLRTSHVKIEASNTGALNAWIKSRPKNLGNGSGSVESNSDFQLAGLPIAPTQPTQRSCGSSKAHTTELARELGMKELYLGGSLLTSAAIADREGDAERAAPLAAATEFHSQEIASASAPTRSGTFGPSRRVNAVETNGGVQPRTTAKALGAQPVSGKPRPSIRFLGVITNEQSENATGRRAS